MDYLNLLYLNFNTFLSFFTLDFQMILIQHNKIPLCLNLFLILIRIQTEFLILNTKKITVT